MNITFYLYESLNPMTYAYPTVVPPETFDKEGWNRLPEPLPDADARLRSLESSLANDVEVMSYPDRQWNYQVAPDMLEVVILGGGHTGRSAAFGLRRHGISNIRILDRNPAGSEGPWRTFARNATLRTPKQVTGGLDWGIPNLNFRRWCAAIYGDEYWQSIDYIPRLLWADYINWYGRVLQLPIQNDTSIEDITWDEARQVFRLHTRNEPIHARFIIFATGMECAGGKFIPEMIRAKLPAHAYHHTMDAIDFAALKGKKVGIIGGGAGAFDNAIACLHAGVASVDIMIRRKHLVNINRIRWSEWNGYHRHYIDLPDETKWYYSIEEMRLGQLPPPNTYYEAMHHENLTLYADAPIHQISYVNGKILGIYGDCSLTHDVLICGTGFVMDLNQQPELKSLAPHVARWIDRYTPPEGDRHAVMEQFPYLGRNLEFTPRSLDHHYLKRCYYLSSGSALLSGFRANLSGLQYALPRVTYDIGRQLFLEHQPEIIEAFNGYDILDF
ncbi:MAG: NAD(P)-binding domain-containing protein [Leptolyngbyaceae bacterium]|nr:NAD(P)-binding domain-containing protein [Leptolyngbyaceae bacterium]